MSGKLKFRAVFSLVIGSQIGSGVFLLPASLAMIGPISLFSWFISGSGAVLLALVFAQLSILVSKGGGPHIYVERAFGREVAFFTAWTYWLVSWVSSLAVIIAAVGYLSSFITLSTPASLLLAQILIITAITLINIRGTTFAGSLELFLTLMKCIPLIIIPIGALFFLKPEYFYPLNPSNLNLIDCLNSASFITFWGFIGVEAATTTAALVENPTKTIPRAVIFGTLTVAVIYFFNSFGIMGTIPSNILAQSQAPYVAATEVIFGSGWNLVIAAIALIACLGTLNAWILTSGQIAVEAAKDNLFPPLFAKTNKFGAPYMSLLIVLFCTIGLLIFTLTPNILAQLNYIIDISVTTFLLIYLLCAISFIRIIFQEKIKHARIYLTIGSLAALFCVWILLFVPPINLLLCSFFIMSGVPIYFWQKKKIQIRALKQP